jgi:WD40 repeat protein
VSFPPIVIMTYSLDITCIRQSIYTLQGHTGTIRCLKVLHNQPIAVTGSQDKTLRVWDVRKGKQLYATPPRVITFSNLKALAHDLLSSSHRVAIGLTEVSFRNCYQFIWDTSSLSSGTSNLASSTFHPETQYEEPAEPRQIIIVLQMTTAIPRPILDSSPMPTLPFFPSEKKYPL